MIDLSRVGQILARLSSLGSIRRTPEPGDLSGEFDGWFDEGAFRVETGKTIYVFRDFTKVKMGVSPWLSITIEFANGAVIDVVERDRPGLHDVCAGCGGKIELNITYQMIDGRSFHLSCADDLRARVALLS